VALPADTRDPRFANVEAEYRREKARWDSGEITKKQLDAILSSFVFEYAGRRWTIGAKYGEWFAREGGKWVGADPPTDGAAAAAATAPLPAQTASAPAAAPAAEPARVLPRAPAPSPPPPPPPRAAVQQPAQYPPQPRQAPPPQQRYYAQPPPQQPEREGIGRLLLLRLAGAAVSLALVAGIAWLAGAFDGDDGGGGQPAASDPAPQASPSPAEPATPDTGSPDSRSEDGGSDSGTTAPAPTGTGNYSTGAYTAEPPSDWTLAEDDVDKGGYRRTRWVSPDGSRSVLIDRAPGESTSPADKAAQVEAAVRDSTPGYERISFSETVVNGEPAFEWVFMDRGRQKVDLFLNRNGDGYAVLGTGAPDNFAVVNDVTRLLATSIEPR